MLLLNTFRSLYKDYFSDYFKSDLIGEVVLILNNQIRIISFGTGKDSPNCEMV